METNNSTFQNSDNLFDRINFFVMIIKPVVNEKINFLLKKSIVMLDTIYCIKYKPRGASPLGQFLLVGPLFLCVEKVRGRK
jgi:hypothetical protein